MLAPIAFASTRMQDDLEVFDQIDSKEYGEQQLLEDNE